MNFFDQYDLANCPCGKDHSFSSDIIIGAGVINRLPQILENHGVKKVFLLADPNTYAAAGEAAEKLLNQANIAIDKYVFDDPQPEPDEQNVGLAVMHYPQNCDAVIGVGSGVINDIGKIVAATAGKLYIIVGTAPSMDGYASATSSMTRAGLKISLPSKCADMILADIDILRQAPMKALISGLGDMLAKYVSICEWRIANIITGEYYCETIAQLVRTAVKKCVDNAQGLLERTPEAVTAVTEGLILCGAAMKFADCSRPASGTEHYFSHIWDMRGVSFGTPVETHGIQCALGTLLTVELYEKLLTVSPDKEKALAYAAGFDYAAWSEELKRFLGKGAESMIALEKSEGKYNTEKHQKRLDVILDNWSQICAVIRQELPNSRDLEALLKALGLPTVPEQIGIDPQILPMTFCSTKDIRDKYVLARLCWDLGILDEMKKL